MKFEEKWLKVKVFVIGVVGGFIVGGFDVKGDDGDDFEIKKMR